MNAERVKTLEQFYVENPDDPFTIYALALEYADADPLKAERLFEKLLTDFEEYLPSYYQATHFFTAIGKPTKAINTATKGIEIAKAAKQLKTMGELRSLLDTLDEPS